MSSSYYKGLYVQRHEDGTIHGVQIVDKIGGHEISLSPEKYRERGVRPLIEELPDKKDYKASNS